MKLKQAASEYYAEAQAWRKNNKTKSRFILFLTTIVLIALISQCSQ